MGAACAVEGSKDPLRRVIFGVVLGVLRSATEGLAGFYEWHKLWRVRYNCLRTGDDGGECRARARVLLAGCIGKEWVEMERVVGVGAGLSSVSAARGAQWLDEHAPGWDAIREPMIPSVALLRAYPGLARGLMHAPECVWRDSSVCLRVEDGGCGFDHHTSTPGVGSAADVRRDEVVSRLREAGLWTLGLEG